jgi:hypothetical protein
VVSLKRQPPPNSSAQTSNVWVGLVSQAGSVQQCRAVYGGRVCIDFLPLEDKLGGVEHGIIGSTAQRSVAIASARLASMPSTASRASAADRLPLLQACSRAVHPSTSCRLVLIPSASRRARRHGSWSAFAASDHQANKSSTVCLGVFCAVAVAAIAWAAQLHAYYCPSYLRVCWNGASTSAPDCALCFASVGFLCHPIKYSCAAVANFRLIFPTTYLGSHALGLAASTPRSRRQVRHGVAVRCVCGVRFLCGRIAPTARGL